jgi:peptidoglycan hydrolase-like protein with peptidoglycan-binding domain
VNTLDLQHALIRLGLDPGFPDGVQGPQTIAALAKFHATHGFSSVDVDESITDAVAALPAPTPFIIDVSVAQPVGSIDLVCAKACACIGLIARAEYGTKIDGTHHPWLDAAEGAGLRTGVYAFQMTDADPDDEVKALVAELGGRKLDYGVSLDVETRNGASPGNIVTWSDAFISEVEQARSEPFGMLYTGPGFWNGLGVVAQDAKWATRKLWVANYGASSPARVLPWAVWGKDGGPVLWQRFANTIWRDNATGQQQWGKAQPGPSYVKIANPYFSPWSRAEVDVSQLPGSDDASLLVTPPT